MITGLPKLCKRCRRVVAATVADPCCTTSHGTFHYKCMLADAAERSKRERDAREATRARRAANARRLFGHEEKPDEQRPTPE